MSALDAELRRRRYHEIMARIARPGPPFAREKGGDALASALDALGAFALLEAQGRSVIPGWYGYGPKVKRAKSDPNAPGQSAWVGVLGWWRRSSFFAYERLYLLGIWAKRPAGEAEDCEIILGERRLAFRGAYHNPESLHRQLRRDFSEYYAGDVAPPALPLLRLSYQPVSRLSTRLRLETAISEWAEKMAAHASRQ